MLRLLSPVALLLAAAAAASPSAITCPGNVTEGVIIGRDNIATLKSAADVSACCDRCAANGACLAFTFDLAASICYLKDNIIFREVVTMTAASERTNEWTDEQTNKRTNERTDERTNERTNAVARRAARGSRFPIAIDLD